MKNNNIYLSFLKSVLPIIILWIIESIFDISFKAYIDNVPSKYFTLILICTLVFLIFNFFFNYSNKNIIAIASQNDYSSKDSSIGFLTILIIGFCMYIYFVQNPNINTLLFLSVLILLSFINTFLTKTASLEIKNQSIYYKNGKEQQAFKTHNLKELNIAPNEIKIIYQDNEKLIYFLEINDDDYKEIKKWFQKRLPNLIISKSKVL